MKKFIALLILFLGLIILTPKTYAQMMGATASPIASDIQTQQQEEQEGKDLLDKLKNKTTACQNLTNDDFEKIGEYFMGQSIGDTTRHIQMNDMMKSMMGETSEEQMHTAWGKRGSGCDSNASFGGMMGGGGIPMMGFGGMMSSFGILGLITWLLTIAVLVLLVVYLWKQIQKK